MKKMFICLFLVGIVLSFFFGCSTLQKRQADIVVTYEGKVVYEASPRWNTKEQLFQRLEDDEKPDFIIFSADWCRYCTELRAVIEQNSWRGKIVILNVEKEWVKYVASEVGIRVIPAMITTFDGGGINSKTFEGVPSVTQELSKYLGVK